MAPRCAGVLVAVLLAVSVACETGAGTLRKPTVRVGSTNFTEQIILAELYANALEANGYRVGRKLRLGNREVVEPALENGEIDLYGEYLASAESFLARETSKASTDPGATQQALQNLLKPRGVTVLDYAPAVDQNGLVVTRTTATLFNLVRTSDLIPVSQRLVLGGPPECPVRPFCLAGLERVYGVKFKDFKPLDPSGPMTVTALLTNQIDVAVMFTTDARIAENSLVLLEDDRSLQLADNIAPLVRNALLNRAPPDLRGSINAVSAKLTTAELTSLAKAVDIDRTDPRDAAMAWLKAKRLAA